VANAEPATTLPMVDCPAAAIEPPELAATRAALAITALVSIPALAPNPISIHLR